MQYLLKIFKYTLFHFQVVKKMLSLNDIKEEEYLFPNDWTEIKCVIKRLYSDFIVIEIPNDGQILQSNQIKKSTYNMAKCSEKEELNKEEIMIPNEFANIASEIQKFKEVSDGLIEECKINLKDFAKDVRKKLHKFIADCYGESLFTRCENGQLQVKKSNGMEIDNRKRRHWPEERGDFLHFTMTKENMDTHSAICIISRKLGLKPSSFSISGTKDRRAITVQRVAIYRMEQSRLENLHFSRIWLSDFNYSNAKLQLGDAKGNRFNIILRDIQPPFDQNEFNKRVNVWEQYGFLNYFGSQRFGTCGVNTAEIGKLILAEKWEDAIRTLLSPRNEANEFLRKSLKCYTETGNAVEALKLLPLGDYSTHIERNLLSTLAKSPNAFKAAILALPRDVRTMYIHAYQSDVFNRIITKRKKVFGLKVLEGDLDKEGNKITDVEKIKIEQIYLPLPSTEPNLPQNEVGKWYEEISKMDQISGNSFQKLERQFAIGSIYRPFIVKPKNVAWEMLEYFDRNQILQHCEFIPKQQNCKSNDEKESVKNAIADQQPSMAIKIQFDLDSGTYATIALRELMRTDFGKDSQRSLEKELLAHKNNIV